MAESSDSEPEPEPNRYDIFLNVPDLPRRIVLWYVLSGHNAISTLEAMMQVNRRWWVVLMATKLPQKAAEWATARGVWNTVITTNDFGRQCTKVIRANLRTMREDRDERARPTLDAGAVETLGVAAEMYMKDLFARAGKCAERRYESKARTRGYVPIVGVCDLREVLLAQSGLSPVATAAAYGGDDAADIREERRRFLRA